MVNSIQKGKRGEREAAKLIQEVLGVEARRGQQFSGSKESPDVVTGVKGVHFEVKNVEKLNLESAMEQSIRDSGNLIPVVLHKKSRKDWLITVRFTDLPGLSQAILSSMNGPSPKYVKKKKC